MKRIDAVDVKETGMNIMNLRRRLNMKQVELGIAVGYDEKSAQEMCSVWERGRSCPSLSALIRMAEVFNLPIEEIIVKKERNNDSEKNPV